MTIRVGVLGSSDIAKRRMIPALIKHSVLEYAGVAIADYDEWENNEYTKEEYSEILNAKKKKASELVSLYRGDLYIGYETLLKDNSIDAVYIPLPPAFHFKWAKRALEYGKHVLLEKPFTTNQNDAKILISLANKKNLAIVENYGFIYHSQFELIKNTYYDGKIGDLRLIRACFGFPHRSDSDFRYSKKYGGGALLDCGGYTLKAASLFMNNPQVISSSLFDIEKHDVDIYGSITLQDPKVVAQLSFGMDNSYKCDFELLGSIGSIISKRAFTAPDTLDTIIEFTDSNGTSCLDGGKDDQFYRIVDKFYNCIINDIERVKEYESIHQQSKLMQKVEDVSLTVGKHE